MTMRILPLGTWKGLKWIGVLLWILLVFSVCDCVCPCRVAFSWFAQESSFFCFVFLFSYHFRSFVFVFSNNV